MDVLSLFVDIIISIALEYLPLPFWIVPPIVLAILQVVMGWCLPVLKRKAVIFVIQGSH